MANDMVLKNYDMKKLRKDLKDAVGGEDGLTMEHLGLRDRDLALQYIYVYGKESFEEYKKEGTITRKEAVKANLRAYADSLLGIAHGKCYILEGNSLSGDQDHEEVYLTKDNIGYVMMGIKTKTVLPIARGDEHHKGFDLVENLIKENLIPNDKYLPIFCLGSDYLHEDDFKDALIIFPKWLQMGGPNIILEDWHGAKEGFIIDMKSFVEKQGKSLKPRKGTIATVGKTLISMLTEVSLSGVALRKSADPEADFKKYTVPLKKLLNLCTGPIYFRCHLHQALKSTRFEDVDLLLEEIKKPTKPALELLQEIEEALFGMKSFKKIVHDDIRENMANPGFDYKDLNKLFGDLQKAFDALGRI